MEFCTWLRFITTLCIVFCQLDGLDQTYVKITIRHGGNGDISYYKRSDPTESESNESSSNASSTTSSDASSTNTSSRSSKSKPSIEPSMSKTIEKHSHSSKHRKHIDNKNYTTNDILQLMKTAKEDAELCYVVCLSNPGFTSGMYDSEYDSCQCLMMGTNAVVQILLPYSVVKFNKREKCTVLCKYQKKIYFRGDYNSGSKECNCYTTERGDEHPGIVDFTNEII